MTNVATYESIQRTPACTLEEARQLIDDLRAEFGLLGESERMEVRRALEQYAQSLVDAGADADWD